MMIDTDNLVTMTEANQNFSSVARTVDENGIPLESWEFTDAMYGGLLTYFDKVMGETQWEDAK